MCKCRLCVFASLLLCKDITLDLKSFSSRMLLATSLVDAKPVVLEKLNENVKSLQTGRRTGRHKAIEKEHLNFQRNEIFSK